MKKKISTTAIFLMAISVLTSTYIVAFAKGSLNRNEKQPTNVDNTAKNKNDEGNKLSEIDSTWGEFLDLYVKENPDVAYYNPRDDLNKEHKVRVVKTEYPNGFETKAGFFTYGIVTKVYDAETGELLTSGGHYTNK